jgi:hypothetical protein
LQKIAKTTYKTPQTQLALQKIAKTTYKTQNASGLPLRRPALTLTPRRFKGNSAPRKATT